MAGGGDLDHLRWSEPGLSEETAAGGVIGDGAELDLCVSHLKLPHLR